jgi:sugar (pentulose or hexulose) kinase
LDVPYQTLDRSVLGTWGSALIAGKAAGLVDDLASRAMECAQPAGAPILPDPENRALYAPLVERYIRLQSSLDEYFSA